MGWGFAFGILFPFFCLFAALLCVHYENTKNKHKILSLAQNIKEMSLEEFMEFRKACLKKKKLSSWKFSPEFYGIYIIYNKNLNIYYVGQSKNILERVPDHFGKKGCTDIHYDYQRGHSFTIKMIPLYGSNFFSLDKLERCAIMTYNSYRCGYNKTPGNRT